MPRLFWKSRDASKLSNPATIHPEPSSGSIETGLVQAAELAQVGDALKLSVMKSSHGRLRREDVDLEDSVLNRKLTFG